MSRRVQRLAAACAAATCLSVVAAEDASAEWVIRGHGFGHGVGMGQYGAYGYAKHGRGYRWILGHYYRHTHVGHTNSHRLRVLLGTAQHSMRFTRAKRACGHRLSPRHTYRFTREGDSIVLRRRTGARIKGCGDAGVASGKGAVRIFGHRDYRGEMIAKASGGRMLVINAVGLEAYVRGVIPNEMPASWSANALRAQAVAARSYALATGGGRPFDVYDDTRDQVYGGKDSEAHATNAATRHTAHQVVRHGSAIATTYFSSTSGGRTENVEYGFPGATPRRYLKSVRDRYDRISPYHSWRVTYSGSHMANHLSGLFSGHLKRIHVTKRGVSPRIVRARVVGSHGSSTVSGGTLQSRLGLRSTWAFFKKRHTRARAAGAGARALASSLWDPFAPAGAAEP
jgi:stage II sporulation protein D